MIFNKGLVVLIAAVLVSLLLAPGIAYAQQAPCGNLTTIVSAAVVPSSGLAGSSAVVGGDGTSLDLEPRLLPGQQVSALWDNSASLGSFTADANNHFGGNITIPPGAAPGEHLIYLHAPGDPNSFCLAFTVTTVQTDAYTATRTSMPSTGYMLLLPVAGLLGSGAAALAMTCRSGQRSG